MPAELASDPCRSSFDIRKHAPPRAIPELPAICHKGLEPSIAAALSMTTNLTKSQAINSIAFAAKSPGTEPTPSPSGGNTAPGS
eukprot:14060147-Alexandrium_andersonii.AAC.1